MSTIAKTNRLTLREADDGDFFALFDMFNDGEVMRFYRGFRDESLIGAKETGEFLGYCGLLVYPIQGTDEIELGYMLKRKAWGYGYATEAALASLSIAREKFGYGRVVSIIDVDNWAARCVAERLGMDEKFVAEDSTERVVYSINLY